MKNESEAVVVHLGMDLQQILDVDEKAQTLLTNVWLNIVSLVVQLEYHSFDLEVARCLFNVGPFRVWQYQRSAATNQ